MKFALKWPVVIATFIITLSLIYGANYWRQQNLVMEPLREQILSLDGVHDLQVEGGTEKTFTVFLGQVPRLADTYREIERILQSHNEDNSKIIIADQRNAYLDSLYARIHFALMEGERRGNYTAMNSKITSLLEGEKELSSYYLAVDQQRIYLHLSTKEHFLYEIIPIRSESLVSENAGS